MRVKQQGLSLVELMVAAAVGLVVLAGLTQVFFSSKKTSNTANALARMQENGRAALELLARDIRMAGFQGCADLATIPITINARVAPTTNLYVDALRGFEVGADAWDPSPGAYLEALEDATGSFGVPKVGSDLLVIQRASEVGVELVSNMAQEETSIHINGNPTNIGQDDLVIISDCNNADLFSVTNVVNHNNDSTATLSHGSDGNLSPELSKPYQAGSAEVLRFVANAYFIADTGRNNDRGQDIFGLFRSTNGQVEELIEGVEHLQIQYGEELPNGNRRYVSADDADLDMGRVKAVRLAILVNSVESVRSQPDDGSYALLDLTVQPVGTVDAEATHAKDGLLRSTFVSTVMLRNRR
ncbi:MAG: PilW family protein [Chromatiales bacterium]|nr:PilW family protein [Chromatiales bacterium]